MGAAVLESSVARYNELCDLGMDLDYGKPSRLMKKIEAGPFYALHYEYAVSAITSGLIVNEFCEVQNNDNQTIEPLYAVGNCSGPFYAGIDYPLEVPGGSISRAITFGYLTGKLAAAK